MTLLLFVLTMMGAEMPVILFAISIPCDAAVLIVAMLTGLIYK